MVASSRFFFQLKDGRAVVGQHLARVNLMHGFGELAGEFQIRRAGFAPHQVGVLGVGDGAGDGLVQTLLGLVEAFGGALAGQEGLVVLVVVGGQQVGSFGIGTGDDQGRHAVDVGSHTGGDQLLAQASWSEPAPCRPCGRTS
jgi:hypothetical protein